ncbi:MAG TPA: hypothetical protein VHF22_13300, partial [Planctomycetota bacterium]|nr:hypothetical protein [Planctomycetota bacterium]
MSSGGEGKPHQAWVFFFEGFLRRSGSWLLAVLALSAILGFFGLRVHPDFSVEYLFPEKDAAKTDYDRYKKIYPYEDARALVMVEAPDLWTPAGLARIAALEKDLAAIEIPTKTAVTADAPDGTTRVAA